MANFHFSEWLTDNSKSNHSDTFPLLPEGEDNFSQDPEDDILASPPSSAAPKPLVPLPAEPRAAMPPPSILPTHISIQHKPIPPPSVPPQPAVLTPQAIAPAPPPRCVPSTTHSHHPRLSVPRLCHPRWTKAPGTHSAL